MEIISLPIKSLQLDPTNARKHDTKNIDAIKGSLAKFGQQHPIIIDDNNVVLAGNGRLVAAKDLGWDSIECVKSNLKTMTEKTAFALADNRTAELAEWDDDILGGQLQALYEDDFDIAEIGFDPSELSLGVESEGKIEDDQVPETNDNAFNVKRGDIWQLGEHRVMCGDSTSKEDVDRLMDGNKADMVFTSPPYNGNTTMFRSTLYKDNNSDNKTSNEYINFNKLIFSRIAEATTRDCNVFYNINYNKKSRSEYLEVILNAIASGFNLFESICWKKSSAMPNQGPNVMTRSFEFIFLLNRSEGYKSTKIYNVGTTVSNYWDISNNKVNTEDHKACFPIALVEKGIEITDPKNVYEPFLGSGSTLIACEKTNRKCCGMEIDPHYCSVIINRWQEFTGKTAVKLA